MFEFVTCRFNQLTHEWVVPADFDTLLLRSSTAHKFIFSYEMHAIPQRENSRNPSYLLALPA